MTTTSYPRLTYSGKPLFDPIQQRAIDLAASSTPLLITGTAGTGKSFILNEIRSRLKCDVVASTGIAAVNVGGLTINSWAGLGLADKAASIIARAFEFNKSQAYYNILNASYLCFDEVSMTSNHFLDLLSDVCKLVRGNTAPLGGIIPIFFGDFLQLPPVSRDNSASFCFFSRTWADLSPTVICLKHIYRQADPDFIRILNNIRIGHIDTSTSRFISSALTNPPPADKPPIVIATHNIDVDAVNSACLAKLPGNHRSYAAVDKGESNHVTALQRNCLAPTVLQLKTGARVMLLKNVDPLSGLANGSLGTVTNPAKYSHKIEVAFDCGSTITLEPHTWETVVDNKIVATRRQFPLRLAYAITAHKSQGMTLDSARLYLDKCFTGGQAFVAISRVRSPAGLHLSSIGPNSIFADSSALAFYRQHDPELMG